jgi:hypothetical protein
LVELCLERDVAMQTIKSVARRRWPEDAAGPRYSWYEPLRDPGAVDRAVRYVLSSGPFFLNSSSDANLLRPILEAADRMHGGPSPDDLDADVAVFEVTPLFDGAGLERI